MIYCVWYPSGGYGSYLTALIDRFGINFARPRTLELEFSHNGDSHAAVRTVPPYRDSCKGYKFNFDNSSHNYCVAVDNGITNQNLNFLDVFPGAQVIKVTYDDHSWPIVAHTMITKAMKVPLDQELAVEQNWPCDEPWAVREKYFLYLVENHLRHSWKPSQEFHCIDVCNFWNYTDLVEQLHQAGITVLDFSPVHQSWQDANFKYFNPVIQAKEIIKQVVSGQCVDITGITDLWEQAVVNYFIQIEFGVTVPANTYANWFGNTKEISDLINALQQ